MNERMKNYIIINLNNDNNYCEKSFNKIISKFKGNFSLISHIKYVYIIINADIKHIFSLKIEGNELIEFKEDNIDSHDDINIEEILNTNFSKEYDESIICPSLIFDFECDEEKNIKFIEKFYNCDYALASLTYKILNATKHKTNNKLACLYWKNKKLYINSKIIKVILIILKYLVFPVILDLLLNKFEINSNFIDSIVDFVVDILLILIEKDFVIYSNKSLIYRLKRFVMKHLKEIIDTFKHKGNIKDFFDRSF